jgi:hypothetical protein
LLRHRRRSATAAAVITAVDPDRLKARRRSKQRIDQHRRIAHSPTIGYSRKFSISHTLGTDSCHGDPANIPATRLADKTLSVSTGRQQSQAANFVRNIVIPQIAIIPAINGLRETDIKRGKLTAPSHGGLSLRAVP